MEITKVLKVENGFKVNDQFFIPEDENNKDYQDILAWVAQGNEIKPEFTPEENVTKALNDAKIIKIYQLKANRNAALEKPFVACKAREWSEDGEPQKDEVYFEFSTKSTGIQLTEPNTIIFGAMILGGVIKYSCTIIETENRREGYVILNQAVAQKVSSHLTDRGTTYVAYANEKEVEINACPTLEQLELINIDF
jgi:hypothetical protein